MTQITDEAVEAALTAWVCGSAPNSSMDEDMRAALTAAIPHLQAGYKVKQLEWDIACEMHRADRYKIEDMGENWKHDRYQFYIDKKKTSTFPTLDEAKASAQADFERRVRECIVGGIDVAAVRRQALDEATRNLTSELSGNTGGLIDMMASAIRADGSDLFDAPWESLSDDRKLAWRGDAERALAAVKEYLTTRATTPAAPTTEAGR